MSTNSENSAIASTSGAGKKRKNTQDETVVADTSRRSSGRRSSKKPMLNYTNDDDDDDDDDYDDDFGADDDYEDDEDADLQEYMRNANEAQIQNKNDSFDNVVIKSEIMLDDYICPDVSVNNQTQAPSNNSADMTIDNNLETIEENGTLIEIISKLRADVKDLKRTIGFLTEEVISLKSELKCNNVVYEQTTFMPEQIKDENTLNIIEEQLKEKALFNSMMGRAYRLTAKDPKQFLRNCFRSIFNDELAKNITWLGRKHKRAANNLLIIATIRGAFQKKYPHESLNTFEFIGKKFFHYANDRLKKKMNYKIKYLNEFNKKS